MVYELTTDPSYYKQGKQSQIHRLEEEILARDNTIEQLNARIKTLERELSKHQSDTAIEESPKKTRKIKELVEQIQHASKEHRSEDKKFQ